MLEQSILCPPSPHFPFYIAAKRYYRLLPPLDNDITLILLHSTSFHKEIWEPTIAALFELFSCQKDSNVRIIDAYAIDCPNHGVSAVLNENLLKNHEFSCHKYAEAVAHFFKHEGVGLAQRNLICVGHSLGGVASAIFYSFQHKVKFASMILIEPMFSNDKYVDTIRTKLVRLAHERRDTWSSRQEALANFKRGNWHPTIVELFIKYGLRDHPASNHEVAPYKGVTLACPRDQEAIMYRDRDGAIKPLPDLYRTCSEIPVHIIWGDLSDYIPREVQEALTNPPIGSNFASVTRLPNCGHLIPQQNPEALALVLFRILTRPDRLRRSRSLEVRPKL